MKDKLSTIPINQEEIATYLKDIRKIKVMTPERERELASRILSGNITLVEKREIERELLMGNLRFVITVAKQYQNQGLAPHRTSSPITSLIKTVDVVVGRI